MPVLSSVSKTVVVENLERIASEARIFVSMPSLAGITPRVLLEKGIREIGRPQAAERSHGTFRMDEIGLSAFDHGVLYGDAVFEGVLIVENKLFQWREHLARMYRSAERLQIEVPYSRLELTVRLQEAVSCASLSPKGCSYVRLVLTRGIGDLGIHPLRCAGSTLYAIIAKVQLYPESVYQQGMHLSLARKIRRPGQEILDPQIKSCNYLNNVMALLETLHEGCNETVMLTSEGFVAEATTDNLFLVVRDPGWESDPARITLCTPSSHYCLKGITRELVITYAKKLGFNVVESDTMLPKDLLGPHREIFLTGTAAGLAPVVAVDGQQVGSGTPGPVTTTLRDLLLADMSDPKMSLAVSAGCNETSEYLKGSNLVVEQTPSVAGQPLNLIQRLFERVDTRNWETLKDVFCDDVTYERPGYLPLVGLERVTRFYREERVIASGNHFLENVVMTQDSGACWGRFVGLHKNNSAIDERFADGYLFRNGKIWNRKSYFFRPAV